MKNPKISIVVPIYNVEDYLPRCIESICQQTYKNLEIILVNDGSTDHSSNICDLYAQKDDRILVIHKQNGGLVTARKAGLRVSSGNYIGFVDGDDYIEPNMYDNLLRVMLDKDADVVDSGVNKNGDNKCRKQYKLKTIDRDAIIHNIEQYVLRQYSEYAVCPNIWCKLFKSDVIKKCYNMVPDSQSYGEDLLCLIALVCENKKIVTIPHAYYNYTIRENSIMHQKSEKRYINILGLYNAIIEMLNKYGFYHELENELSSYLRYTMLLGTKKNLNNPFAVQVYQYKNIHKLYGKKVIIYGAGDVGCDFYSQICRMPECHIVAWVDMNYKKIKYDGITIQPPNVVIDLAYDYILIAHRLKGSALQIREYLLTLGVEQQKILWEEVKIVE